MVPLFRLAPSGWIPSPPRRRPCSIIPTSLAGLSKHLRNRTCIPRIGLICGSRERLASPRHVLAATHSRAGPVMGRVPQCNSSITMLRPRRASSMGAKGATAAFASSSDRRGTLVRTRRHQAAGACAGREGREGCTFVDRGTHAAMTTPHRGGHDRDRPDPQATWADTSASRRFIMVPLFISFAPSPCARRRVASLNLIAVLHLALSGRHRTGASQQCACVRRPCDLKSDPCRVHSVPSLVKRISQAPFAYFSHRSRSSLPSYW